MAGDAVAQAAWFAPIKPFHFGTPIFDPVMIATMLLGSLMLAEAGARIIKVEPPDGDETRGWGPPFVRDDHSAYFDGLNRNKRNICIDLRDQEGQALLGRMLEGADVVIAAMHSIIEYQDDADAYQKTTAHSLIDSGAFDAVYGHGSHSVQPIENYHGTWIVYGVGNNVTESAPPSNDSNNQGLLARFQFARGADGQWWVSDLAWAPSSNTRGGAYAWCPVASDAPAGVCRSRAEDRAIRERIDGIVALCNALGRAMLRDESAGRSVYQARGPMLL